MNETDYNRALHLAGLYDGDVELVNPRVSEEGMDRLVGLVKQVEATLGHNFNQDLTAVLGFTQIGQMDIAAGSLTPEKAGEYLKSIQEAGRRMDKTIKSLQRALRVGVNGGEVKSLSYVGEIRTIDLDSYKG